MRGHHFIQAAELCARTYNARFQAKFLGQTSRAQNILLIVAIKNHNGLSLNRRLKRRQSRRRLWCIIALRMSLPHRVGLHQPLRVKKSLANYRHGSHERAGVAAVVWSFIANMSERNILSRVGNQLLHLAIIVGQQHNHAFTAKNSSVGIHRRNREAHVAHFFSHGACERPHVGHAHLRRNFVIPIMGRILSGGARRSGAINHQSRVDQSGIHRQTFGINHICSSRRNHRATFSNRANPTILHQHGAIFNALSGLHHHGCVFN